MSNLLTKDIERALKPEGRTLLITIGNSLREDDGVGPFIGENIRSKNGRFDEHSSGHPAVWREHSLGRFDEHSSGHPAVWREHSLGRFDEHSSGHGTRHSLGRFDEHSSGHGTRHSLENFKIINAYSAPENIVSAAVDFKPDKIILIDAAHFGGMPGEIRIIPLDKMAKYSSLSTHNFPLQVIFGIILEDTGATLTIIGVQSEKMDYGENLSLEVKNTALNLIDYFNKI
ncbi:MAG: hydrogenase maturation protease [Elusimicrobia bacterium]|nr:hydrogenase maturation protease [Elusimicrobiota bacterium]